jgi:hypothetical protein
MLVLRISGIEMLFGESLLGSPNVRFVTSKHFCDV